MKNKGKTANETEINNLSDTELKSLVIRMLIKDSEQKTKSLKLKIH